MASASISSRSRYVLTVGSCLLVAVFEGFDIQAIGVAGPLLVSDLHLSPSQAGAIFSIDMVGFVVGAAMGGWFADRLGRRPLLIGSVALFGVSTLAMTLAASYSNLLIIRFTTGSGLGAAMTSLVSIAIATSPPALRTRTVTLVFCGLPTGGALCALTGSIVMTAYGWKSLFIIGGILPILFAPLLHFVVSEQKLATENVKSNLVLRPFHALFSDNRATPTIFVWIAFFLTLMILYLMLKWLPLLVGGKSLGVERATAAAFWFTSAGVVGIPAIGYMVDKYGAIWPIVFAYLGVIAGMASLAFSGAAPVVLVSAGVVGFCLLGALYSLYGIVPMFYPPEIRGVGIGAAIAVGRLGSIGGPLVVGALLTVGWTAGSVLLLTVPIAAVACIAAIAASQTATFYRI